MNDQAKDYTVTVLVAVRADDRAANLDDRDERIQALTEACAAWAVAATLTPDADQRFWHLNQAAFRVDKIRALTKLAPGSLSEQARERARVRYVARLK